MPAPQSSGLGQPEIRICDECVDLLVSIFLDEGILTSRLRRRLEDAADESGIVPESVIAGGMPQE